MLEKGKTYHCHFEIDYLLNKPDSYLKEMLSIGGKVLTPKEARSHLNDLKSKGMIYLSGCDNPSADGSCQGHDIGSQGGEG